MPPLFLYAFSAPAIAALAWLFGVHWLGAIATGLVFGGVIAFPALQDVRNFRYVLSTPSDPPGDPVDLRRLPFVIGGCVAVPLLFWAGLAGALLLGFSACLLTNAVLSLRSGESIPMFGVRWLVRWRRDSNGFLFWGSVLGEVAGAVITFLVGLAFAFGPVPA